ncbi:MAG TPA: SDR family oxidoreductase [Candidatus Dormibacteraeota bacterium]|nr:SDR family oxidoreductase [Candidatus Dormibacteraeota bacterium]
MNAGALTGKVGVVTGGGSGIGRAVALGLARQGADVVVADFDAPRMDRAVEEILRLRTAERSIALSTDVRSDASVRALAHGAIKSMGKVDILVNAAGVLLQGKLDRITSHDWNWMLETNLLGAVRTTTAFLSHMTERGSGHIINIVSFGGLHPGDANTIPYDAGHAALAAFTEALAQQTTGTDVHISLFCLSQKAPKIGQNTRSRGVGRWLRDDGPPEAGRQTNEQMASTLVEAIHHPRFLIAGDPADLPALEPRWGHVDSPAAGT